ncbi:MAG: alpha/beta hydrolase [Opitutales bacterium]|nr:alpha/beta hydrolase [Opitutales bacterium]
MIFCILKIAAKVAVCAVLAYAALSLFAYLFADKIAFPAPKPSYNLKTDPRLKMLPTPLGAEICSIFLKNPEAQYTIIFSHGNGEDLIEIMPKLEHLHNLGFSVFAYDYFGYGQSGLKSSAKNIEACAQAAMEYLINEEKIPAKNIAIFGYSMGSAPSSFLAKKYNPRCLVLMCGFASAFQTQTPKNLLPWDMLNNAQKLKDVHCPVLIFHGTRDCIIRHFNSEILFESANAPKFFASIKGAGHYDVPNLAPEAFYLGVKNFINTLDPQIKNAQNVEVFSQK